MLEKDECPLKIINFDDYNVLYFKDLTYKKSNCGSRMNPHQNLQEQKLDDEAKINFGLSVQNTNIKNFEGLDFLVQKAIQLPKNLIFLNCTNNKIDDLQLIFLEAPYLQTLILNNNQFIEMKQLVVLKKLKELKELSLIGNIILMKPNYRKKTICMLQQLQILDKKQISQNERNQAVNDVLGFETSSSSILLSAIASTATSNM